MFEFTLLASGLGIGFLGTLLGLGGGFIMVPLLLYLYHFQKDEAVATSHFVITLNALSGSIAYDLQRKIDYRLALWMAATAVPGAILGSAIVTKVHGPWFLATFGVMLYAGATYMLVRSRLAQQEQHADRPERMKTAMTASFGGGIVASIMGIGGGMFHVPILTFLLHKPMHRATATSHFILLLTSLVAAASLRFQGHGDLRAAAWLGIGVIVGAQLGAKLSPHVKDPLLRRFFAGAVVVAATRMLWDGVKGILGR